MPNERRVTLSGRRVLLVEDEALVALLLEDMLEELGCVLAGTAATVDDGLRHAESVDADVALLDINLGGYEIFPVAERLSRRGIPLVFSSGYDADSLPEKWRTRPLVRKPCLLSDLEEALETALANGPAVASADHASSD